MKAESARREELWFVARLAVLFAVAVGAFMLLSMAMRGSLGNSRYARVKLPDGTWLVVQAVTTGKSHPVEVPYPVDIQLSRWERGYKNSTTTTNDRMVVWL